MVVRCIAKVADAYKTVFTLHKEHVRRVERTNKNRAAKNLPPKPLPVMEACKFRAHGSAAYDDRRFSNGMSPKTKSPFGQCRDGSNCLSSAATFRNGYCNHVRVKVTLFTRMANGHYWLCAMSRTTALKEVEGFLGVDLGLVQLASDSEGNWSQGQRSRRYAAALPNTALVYKRKARRKPSGNSKVNRRQSRYSTWLNHNISKNIVRTAFLSCKALALEDLEGIRERASAMRREMRWQIGNWSFYQLQTYIGYKAK